MPVDVRTMDGLAPLARALGEEGFAQRFGHPFILGKEILDEQFNFRTRVAKEATVAQGAPPPLNIQDCLLPIMKPMQPQGHGARIFLGRSANNDVVVAHPTVSKLHAYFTQDHAQWWVVDVGSSNGTKMNGMRAPVRSRVPLTNGANLMFGRCAFVFLSARALFARLTGAKAPVGHTSKGLE